MRKGQHPWPTDGVTRKQLDRQSDLSVRRHERQAEKINQLRDRLSQLEITVRAQAILLDIVIEDPVNTKHILQNEKGEKDQ